ncbi:hypothetical protein PFISCL1PPCAC_18367, partial [Pristionchus fissidentatus]
TSGFYHYCIDWFRSARFYGVFCFVFGLAGRFYHVFDQIIQDTKGTIPAYMACPAIVLMTTIAFISLRRVHDAESAPQIFTMVCCCGVLAGAIMEEQLEDMGSAVKELRNDEMAMILLSCCVLSWLIHALEYTAGVSMKRLFACFFLVVVPTWLCVLMQLMPFRSVVFKHSLLYAFFTLAVGMIDYASGEVRARIPLLVSVFAPKFIGCLVQCFGMIALSTHLCSWRTRLYSSSWFSFAWLLLVGPPLVVGVIVCHLIHWTSEKIFGAGPHNVQYVVRAVLVAWAAAAAASHFGWFGPALWERRL